MKKMLLSLLLFTAGNASAQHPYTDSIRRVHNRMLLEDMLWSESTSGWYVGAIGAYDMKSPSLGAEAKFYGASHFLISGSAYGNYRRIYSGNPELPHTAFGLGVHFLIFGLEGNMYLNSDRNWWYLTPKIGFDNGNFSIFYGYGLPLGPNDLSANYGQSLSVKYSLYLGAFDLRKTRRDSWIRHGL